MPATCPACGSRSIPYREEKFRRGLRACPGPLVCGRCGGACDLPRSRANTAVTVVAGIALFFALVVVGVGGADEAARRAVPPPVPAWLSAAALAAGFAAGWDATHALLLAWCAALALRPALTAVVPAPGPSGRPTPSS